MATRALETKRTPRDGGAVTKGLERLMERSGIAERGRFLRIQGKSRFVRQAYRVDDAYIGLELVLCFGLRQVWPLHRCFPGGEIPSAVFLGKAIEPKFTVRFGVRLASIVHQ